MISALPVPTLRPTCRAGSSVGGFLPLISFVATVLIQWGKSMPSGWVYLAGVHGTPTQSSVNMLSQSILPHFLRFAKAQ